MNRFQRPSQQPKQDYKYKKNFSKIIQRKQHCNKKYLKKNALEQISKPTKNVNNGMQDIKNNPLRFSEHQVDVQDILGEKASQFLSARICYISPLKKGNFLDAYTQRNTVNHRRLDTSIKTNESGQCRQKQRNSTETQNMELSSFVKLNPIQESNILDDLQVNQSILREQRNTMNSSISPSYHQKYSSHRKISKNQPNQTNSELRNQLKKMKDFIAKLSQDKQRISGHLREYYDQLQKQRNRNKELQQKMETLQITVSQQDKDIKLLRQSNEQLTKNKGVLQHMLQKLKYQVEKVDKRNQNLQANNKKMKKKIEALEVVNKKNKNNKSISLEQRDRKHSMSSTRPVFLEFDQNAKNFKNSNANLIQFNSPNKKRSTLSGPSLSFFQLSPD